MNYPIGVQSFENVRQKNFAYVDKTHHVYRLASGGKYYFLSRPRRFGKSLLLSTMEAYFQGKRELFNGLAIAQLETEWTEYPVLHVDLNIGNFNCMENLLAELDRQLLQWENLYGKGEGEHNSGARFAGIIRRACEKTGRQVVVLIDEYDKPLLQTITNEQLRMEFCDELRSFYSVLKSSDQYIRFAFLTGVTKFGQLSVFSGLNNLKDITMDARYADICGITEAEILANFSDSVDQLAEACKLSREATLAKLKAEYDGYHFRQDGVGMYNPFSLLNTFDSLEFSHYWFHTGTPKFLVDVLKETDYKLDEMQSVEINGDFISKAESFRENPIPVIYQSGYLTIKGYDEEFGLYRLGFPNNEVERGFIDYLVPYFTPIKSGESTSFIAKFMKNVREGNVEDFLHQLQTLFSGNDYRVAGKKELYFQNSFYLIFKLMGFHAEVEYATANGRIDVLIQTKKYIYVIELKLDGSAEEALRQIEEKAYARAFADDARTLFEIGINFDGETRSIKEWNIQQIQN